jgi:flagellar secretion chaperone FliS
MSNTNPYAQYQRTSIETASPTRLVVMLYDGAIRFLNKAIPAMETKNYYEQSLYINKTQAIIAHLFATLDYDKGGSVAKALSETYVMMYDTLTAANIKDDVERLRNVASGLRELREAWVEVDRQAHCTQTSARSAQEQVREFAVAA